MSRPSIKILLSIALASISAGSQATCYKPGCYSVYGDWGHAIYDDGAIAWTTSSDMMQTLAFACRLEDKGCQWEAFLRNAKCNPGEKTKVLVAGDAGSEEVSAVCATPSDAGMDGNLLLIDDGGAKSHLLDLIKGSYVTVAFMGNGKTPPAQGKFSTKGALPAVTSVTLHLVGRVAGINIPPDSDYPPDLAEIRDGMIRQCIRGALGRRTAPASSVLAAYYCNCLSQRLLFGTGLEVTASSGRGRKAIEACLAESIRWQTSQAK